MTYNKLYIFKEYYLINMCINTITIINASVSPQSFLMPIDNLPFLPLPSITPRQSLICFLYFFFLEFYINVFLE